MAEEREAGSELSEESGAIGRNVQRFIQSRIWEQESECTIFRIVLPQKMLHPEQYRHGIISLGLYDRTSFDFAGIPKMKGDTFRLALVSAFLVDLGKTTEADWDDVCKSIVENPREMQNLYDEERDKDLPPEAVRSVLTLDAIFLACFCAFFFLGESCSRMLPACWMAFLRETLSLHTLIWDDLMKLENQIPLPLIGNVFHLAFQSGKSFPPDLEKYAAPHCEALPAKDQVLLIMCSELVESQRIRLPGYNFSSGSVNFDYEFHNAKHFLDCLYAAMRWGLKHVPDEDGPKRQHRSCGRLHLNRQKTGEREIDGARLPSATQLHKAGIKFHGRPRGLVEFKVQMVEATLFLPVIIDIEDGCENLWRNLISYESGISATLSADERDEFVSYLEVMDDLIETEKDVLIVVNVSALSIYLGKKVAILMEGRHPIIIRHGLGSDKAVADLFNSMLKNCWVMTSPKWAVLRREMYKYYNNDTRKNLHEFRRTYFGKWWLAISVFAAFALVVMTFLQTLYAMITFYQTDF